MGQRIQQVHSAQHRLGPGWGQRRVCAGFPRGPVRGQCGPARRCVPPRGPALTWRPAPCVPGSRGRVLPPARLLGSYSGRLGLAGGGAGRGPPPLSASPSDPLRGPPGLRDPPPSSPPSPSAAGSPGTPPTPALWAAGPPGIPYPHSRAAEVPTPTPLPASRAAGPCWDPSAAPTRTPRLPSFPGTHAPAAGTAQSHGAEGGSSALGRGEQFCTQQAPPPQPRTARQSSRHLAGLERRTRGQWPGL